MSITTYMPYTPTTGQWVAIQKLSVFFENSDHVFILKGYAGTGGCTPHLPAPRNVWSYRNTTFYIEILIY